MHLSTPHVSKRDCVFSSCTCMGLHLFFQKSALHDCISMCFDIISINIRVSIRVRGLHLVFFPALIHPFLQFFIHVFIRPSCLPSLIPSLFCHLLRHAVRRHTSRKDAYHPKRSRTVLADLTLPLHGTGARVAMRTVSRNMA